jgi:hypothetical protein
VEDEEVQSAVADVCFHLEEMDDVIEDHRYTPPNVESKVFDGEYHRLAWVLCQFAPCPEKAHEMLSGIHSVLGQLVGGSITERDREKLATFVADLQKSVLRFPSSRCGPGGYPNGWEEMTVNAAA